jgi:zinc protease
MSPRTLVLAGAMLVMTGSAGAQQSGVTEFTAAGVRVVLKSVPANEVIALRLYLRGGSANLTAERAGIEQLTWQLATHGTEKYSRDAFAALSARTGTVIGAQATHDYTVIGVQGVRDFWNDTWDLFTQAVLHPTFPDSEFAQVQSQALNGLRQRPDDPDEQLDHLADSVFYAGHAYAVEPEGTVEAVSALVRDDVVRWHRERLTKENLVLVVAGNVDRADIESRVAAAFGALPARGSAARLPAAYRAKPADVLVVSRALPTNYVQGMFVAPGRSDPDYPAMRVALGILSERLFEEVRTKRNLTYAVAAGMHADRANAGFFYVTAVEPDTTLKVMRHEVERLANEPIAAERLGENVNVFVTRYLMNQQANMDQAATLGIFDVLGGGWRRALDFPDRMRAVTPADVQRVARRYLRNMRFVVIGDTTKIDRRLFTSL